MNSAMFGSRKTSLHLIRENEEELTFDFIIPTVTQWSAVNILIPIPRAPEIVEDGKIVRLTDDPGHQKAVNDAFDLRLAVRVANALVTEWDVTLSTPIERGKWLLENVPGDVYNAIATWLVSTIAAKEERIKARVVTFQPA